MQASLEVVRVAGGTWGASLNSYADYDGQMVTTVQVDAWVYVVGDTGFNVSRYGLGDWLARRRDAPTGAQTFETDDAVQAWELLRLMRQDAYVWQCGACDGWIFTTHRPQVGILGCSTCGDGGVDFRHADRHA